MKTFNVESLGCKVNQYEIEALGEGLERLGLHRAAGPESADLFVLNSCSVTGRAGATSRKVVRRAVRANPEVQVLVTGCYAESDRGELQKLTGVDRVFGNGEKESILPWVAAHVLDVPVDAGVAPFRVSRMRDHVRAFIKIEDGCDDRCSFCIIPRLRGPARSRSHDEVIEEVRDVVAAGHQDVVLTGVHLGYYGKESGDRNGALIDLLRELSAIPGLARLKLSSIEVHEVTNALLALMAERPVFSPHFHLPLQSGSDDVLRLMRRKYNTRVFAAKVAAIRERFARPAISTDVIVGFPGETEETFGETFSFVREMDFMKVHVFPYSVREGTEAASMPGRVPQAIIDERKTRLLDLERELAARYRARFLGETLNVLVEGRRHSATGMLTGLTERYLRVIFEGPDDLEGKLVPVVIEAAEEDGILLRGLAAGEEAS